MKKYGKIIALTVVFVTLLCGCSTSSMQNDEKTTEETKEAVQEVAVQEEEPMDAQKIIQRAIEQFENQDHTPLDAPVVHKMLWLGYRQVTYGELDMRIDENGEKLLEDVALNFEHVVEERANGNIDICIDLYFVDEPRELTYCDGGTEDDYSDDYYYLACATVRSDIDSYNTDGKYDSVMTAVQSSGTDNIERNTGYESYAIPVILGVNEYYVDFEQFGYSSFDLCDPEYELPLEDPDVPSLTATAVAVHEWMHQFDNIGYLLDVEFPNTHSYMGEPDYCGYKTYEFAANGYYDYFEFYDRWLSATVPFTDDEGEVTLVGMYPEMWKFTTLEFWSAYGEALDLSYEIEPDEDEYAEDYDEYYDEEYYDEYYYEDEYYE